MGDKNTGKFSITEGDPVTYTPKSEIDEQSKTKGNTISSFHDTDEADFEKTNQPVYGGEGDIAENTNVADIEKTNQPVYGGEGDIAENTNVADIEKTNQPVYGGDGDIAENTDETDIEKNNQPVYAGEGDIAENSIKHRYAQVSMKKFDIKVARKRSQQFIDEELRVAVIGKTGVGKSATCNMIMGKDIFKSSNSINGVTQKTQWHRAEVYGRKVLLIDTPGVSDNKLNSVEIEREIKKCIGIGAPGLHVILFVVELGRFTDDDKTIETFLRYFGKSDLEHHVIIVFTHGDILRGTGLDQFLKDAPADLKNLMNNCQNRRVVFNNNLSKAEGFTQVQGLISLIGKFRLEREIKYYTDDCFHAAEKSLKLREDETRNQLKYEMEQLVKKQEELIEKQFVDNEALLNNFETDEYKIEKSRKIITDFKSRQKEEIVKFKENCDEIINNIRR